MGSRRGFICRMRIGNTPAESLTTNHTTRLRHDNTLGPTDDGHKYAIIHVTGYIKNWSPSESIFSPS